MRIAAFSVPTLALTLTLCACQQEPDFEQRFEEAEADIRERAAQMDEELAQSETGDEAVQGSGPEEAPQDPAIPAP